MPNLGGWIWQTSQINFSSFLISSQCENDRMRWTGSHGRQAGLAVTKLTGPRYSRIDDIRCCQAGDMTFMKSRILCTLSGGSSKIGAKWYIFGMPGSGDFSSSLLVLSFAAWLSTRRVPTPPTPLAHPARSRHLNKDLWLDTRVYTKLWFGRFLYRKNRSYSFKQRKRRYTCTY